MTDPCPITYRRRQQARRGVFVLGLALGQLLTSAQSFATNGTEPIGLGQRDRARGGVDVAVGDSALSQFDNPSSLAKWRKTKLDFGLQLAFPQVHWRGPFGSADSEIDVIPLFNFGAAFPVNDKLTIGGGFHTKSGLINRYNFRHVLFPLQQRRVGADVKNASLSLNAGYQLTERLAVGVGGRLEILTAKVSKVLGPMDVELSHGEAYGGGFQVGLTYQVTDDVTLGAAYRSPTWFGDVSGGRAQASLLGMLPVPLGDGRLRDFRLPQKVTAGAAWDVTDRLKLMGEVRWINYSNSSYKSVTVGTALPIGVKLPLSYQDQWVFATGAEYKLDDRWTLGVGYNYGTNPISRESVNAITSILAKHHATVGLRYEQDNWWIGAGYILGFSESMEGKGHSRIPFGIDYGLSRVEQIQHSIVLGVGFSF